MAEQKVFTEEHVKGLVDDVGGSFKNILKVIAWMRRVFGKKAFVPYITDVIKKHVNSLEDLHEADIETFSEPNMSSHPPHLHHHHYHHHHQHKLCQKKGHHLTKISQTVILKQ